MRPDVLRLDPVAEIQRICEAIPEQVLRTLRRRGAVLGISGGVDSSLVAALCAKALGRDRVLGVLMPERDSSPDSTRLARLMAQAIGIDAIVEDVGPALEAAGCYSRQRDAIRTVFPGYGPGWKCKLTLPSILDSDRLNVFQLTVQEPGGAFHRLRMPHQSYLALLAATNQKQRLRKLIEYTHADRLHYAVAGTPNLLEYDQGFFVKNGDGSADFKPIAHLYKTQVYQLAAHLGVPREILERPPTTDTFSLEQTQEEFFFALPYEKMDLCLYAHDRGIAPDEVAEAVGLTAVQVQRVFKDIESKRRGTRYLHSPPLMLPDRPSS